VKIQRLRTSCVVTVLLVILAGCARLRQAELEKEMDLVIRAGQGKLTAPEKGALTKANHPLLLQLGDPNTSKLIALFANLPPAAHGELLGAGYLKWKLATLDPGRQQVWRDLVQLNVDLAAKQGAAPNPAFSQAALQEAEVGFAVVDIPEIRARVISWYILWPQGPPTWVTVVGVRAAGSQPYFNAHLIQLPLLKGKPPSRLPS